MEELREQVGPNIELRDGAIEDIPQIKELLMESWLEHAQKEPEILDEETMKKEDVGSIYREAYDNSDLFFVRIAEINGQFAGVIKDNIERPEPFWKHRQIARVEDIAVVNEFRRQGVGRKLFRNAKKIAKERGIEQIHSRVYTFNYPMIKLMESEGCHSPHQLYTTPTDKS